MELKNAWDSFKIEEITFDFNRDYVSPVVTFNFQVLKSYDYLTKTYFENVEMLIQDNLPYTMLLKEIFNKCEEIINENIYKY